MLNSISFMPNLFSAVNSTSNDTKKEIFTNFNSSGKLNRDVLDIKFKSKNSEALKGSQKEEKPEKSDNRKLIEYRAWVHKDFKDKVGDIKKIINITTNSKLYSKGENVKPYESYAEIAVPNEEESREVIEAVCDFCTYDEVLESQMKSFKRCVASLGKIQNIYDDSFMRNMCLGDLNHRIDHSLDQMEECIEDMLEEFPYSNEDKKELLEEVKNVRGQLNTVEEYNKTNGKEWQDMWMKI